MICKSLIKMAIVSINMNGTTGSIPDVIQHMIVIRNLVRRLFVKKQLLPAGDGGTAPLSPVMAPLQPMTAPL